MFIGHSEPVTQLCVSQDDTRLISCGDAIFIWDLPYTLLPSHLLLLPVLPIIPKSSSPRRRAPSPMSFEHLKAHSFTPLNNSLTHHKTKERKESSSNGLLVKTQDRGSEGEGVKVTVCNDEHCFEGSRSSTHSTTPTAQKHYQ